MPDQPKSTILVVDDEPVIASSLAAILHASGFQAVAFTDAEKAIHAAMSDCPSVLISDVLMTEMSGIELAIRVKSMCPTCKIVLFSGNAFTNDLMRFAAKQGHEFKILDKPVQPQDVLDAIAEP
jgi:DNA-binding NtrC family response regulator